MVWRRIHCNLHCCSDPWGPPSLTDSKCLLSASTLLKVWRSTSWNLLCCSDPWRSPSLTDVKGFARFVVLALLLVELRQTSATDGVVIRDQRQEGGARRSEFLPFDLLHRSNRSRQTHWKIGITSTENRTSESCSVSRSWMDVLRCEK